MGTGIEAPGSGCTGDVGVAGVLPVPVPLVGGEPLLHVTVPLGCACSARSMLCSHTSVPAVGARVLAA